MIIIQGGVRFKIPLVVTNIFDFKCFNVCFFLQFRDGFPFWVVLRHQNYYVYYKHNTSFAPYNYPVKYRPGTHLRSIKLTCCVCHVHTRTLIPSARLSQGALLCYHRRYRCYEITARGICALCSCGGRGVPKCASAVWWLNCWLGQHNII